MTLREGLREGETLVNLLVKLRRGEGPFWGRLKAIAKVLLRVHIPVVGVTRPFFAALYLVHVFLAGTWHRMTRFFWYEPLFRSQCVSIGARFTMAQMPFIAGSGRIVLGDDVTFGGQPNFVFGNRSQAQPEVVIGNHTFIGHYCVFAASKSIRVGNDVLIAGGVHISDYDGHPMDAERRRAGDPSPEEAIRAVVIGNDVWIGTNATILKGVHIGDRSVVGAGAVVTRDVPPDCVVAGNPARVVKRLENREAASVPAGVAPE